MAGTGIEVNTGTLKSDIDDIRRHIRNLRKKADELRSITTSLNGMWEGEARNEYVASVNADLKALNSLIDAMEKYTGKTDECREEYDRCETAVVQIIEGIRI